MACSILWAGGDPYMTGCLECSLAWPVLTRIWSQTATDGAWYSITVLMSGRDRPQSLCGSEPETRWTGECRPPPPSISLLVARADTRSSNVIRNQWMQDAETRQCLTSICTYQRSHTSCMARGLSVDHLSS